MSLAVLCNVRNPKSLPGLPSWVADWSAASGVRESLGLRLLEHYSAAGSTKAKVRFSPDGQILFIEGKSLAIIQRLGSVMLEGIKEQSEIESEWEQLARTVSSYHTGEIYPTIFWRTLIADDGMHGADVDRTRLQLYKAHYNNLVERHQSARRGQWQPITDYDTLNTRTEQFRELFDATSLGRRIAVTESGFLGLVAADTRIGDHVCVLNGGPVPFVLRQEPSTEYYTLVGECYIQGWMDGSRFKSSPSPIEEFAIC